MYKQDFSSQEGLSFRTLTAMFNGKNILNTVFILLFSILLSLVYLYFAKPKYISHVMLEVDATAANPNARRADDLISSLDQPTAVDIETEMDVIKSGMLIEKASQGVTDGIKYYDLNHFKSKEYYTDTPFLVKDVYVSSPFVFNKVFIVDVLDDKTFQLSLKRSWFSKIKSFFSSNSHRNKAMKKRYHFNQLIKEKSYHFKIDNYGMKVGNKYAFQIMYRQNMINDMRRNINVKSASARSSVIDVSYEDINPYRVRDFLSRLVHAYVEQNIEVKSKDASNTLKFLKIQIGNIKKELTSSSTKLKQYKEKNNFLDLNEKSRAVLGVLVNKEEALEQAKLEYQELEILETEIKNGNYSIASSLQQPYPVLEALITQLQTALARKDELLTTVTTRHPDYIANMKRIESTKRSIAAFIQTLKSSLEKQIKTFASAVSKENKKLESFPQQEQKLANYERIYAVNQRLLSYLLQRESELRLKAASKVSDIRQLSAASLELKPAKPNKTVVIATALFLGLLLSFLMSLLKINSKIKTPDDIKEHTNIPLFGIIPYVKDKKKYNRAYVLEDTTSTASEAFRAIRTNLDYMVTDNKCKVILITSNVPNEGKTVVAANMAAMIGMGEKRVILLGLDLRRPEIHHKFGLSNKLGMSDLLAQKATLKEVIWEHEKYPNLNIITAGKIPPNPAELLSSHRLQKILDTLKESYDVIILDTPPINYVSDAMVLFKYADINLFVVKSDFTEEKYVKALEEVVEKYHLENTGIILNSVKSKYNKLEQFDNKYLYFEPLK